MARAELYKLNQYSAKLFKLIGENDELDGWVQSKITKAADYISSVYHYMEYEKMAASQIESGPRDFEESLQNEVKQSLKDQWLNRKNQGN
jgi:dihydroneopterin aldolase